MECCDVSDSERERLKRQYKGVFWDRKTRRWRCQLGYQSKKIFLGYFETAQEAAKAYDTKLIQLRGAGARTNFPITEYSKLIAAATKALAASANTHHLPQDPSLDDTAAAGLAHYQSFEGLDDDDDTATGSQYCDMSLQSLVGSGSGLAMGASHLQLQQQLISMTASGGSAGTAAGADLGGMHHQLLRRLDDPTGAGALGAAISPGATDPSAGAAVYGGAGGYDLTSSAAAAAAVGLSLGDLDHMRRSQLDHLTGADPAAMAAAAAAAAGGAGGYGSLLDFQGAAAGADAYAAAGLGLGGGYGGGDMYGALGAGAMPQVTLELAQAQEVAPPVATPAPTAPRGGSHGGGLRTKAPRGSGNDSGEAHSFRGVFWDKKSRRWRCQLGHKNKKIFLGYFNDAAEAARAYDAKLVELNGANAKTNFPLHDYLVPTGSATRGSHSTNLETVTLQQRPVPLRSGLGRSGSYTDPGARNAEAWGEARGDEKRRRLDAGAAAGLSGLDASSLGLDLGLGHRVVETAASPQGAASAAGLLPPLGGAFGGLGDAGLSAADAAALGYGAQFGAGLHNGGLAAPATGRGYGGLGDLTGAGAYGGWSAAAAPAPRAAAAPFGAAPGTGPMDDATEAALLARVLGISGVDAPQHAQQPAAPAGDDVHAVLQSLFGDDIARELAGAPSPSPAAAPVAVPTADPAAAAPAPPAESGGEVACSNAAPSAASAEAHRASDGAPEFPAPVAVAAPAPLQIEQSPEAIGLHELPTAVPRSVAGPGLASAVESVQAAA